uniref:Uncharacterized protein n=1 Tax=Eutreptiella gymnastica TaxID=73025 RepID=A0A7S1IFP9_9EUGL
MFPELCIVTQLGNMKPKNAGKRGIDPRLWFGVLGLTGVRNNQHSHNGPKAPFQIACVGQCLSCPGAIGLTCCLECHCTASFTFPYDVNNVFGNQCWTSCAHCGGSVAGQKAYSSPIVSQCYNRDLD